MESSRKAAELARRRAALARLAERRAPDAGEGDQALRARFALDAPEGRRLYESFSDGELLDLLRREAQRLGRSPAQGEVFWVYRSYLRARFKNWPSALRAAGLSRAAGKGGKSLERAREEEMLLQSQLEAVREKAAELGRMPHPSDLPEICAALSRRYRNWGEVLLCAGAADSAVRAVRPIDDLEEPYRAMLAAIRARAEELNRAPQRREVPDEVRAALVERCGSWRNALYQVGLEPVRRITPFANTGLRRPEGAATPRHRGTLYDCYYRLLRLDGRTRAELDLVVETAERLGRAPTRHEVPPETRLHLREVCGSWANALYQVGLHTESKLQNGGDKT